MKVVFGSEHGAAIKVGDKIVDFAKGRVVRSGSTNILIATGDAWSAAHPDPGFLGIWYLRQNATGFTVRKAYPGIVALGSFGAAPEWKIRDDLGSDPVVEVNGFGMWFGHAYTCTSLVSLGGKVPRLLIDRVLTGYEFDPGDDPAEEEPASLIKGTISYDYRHDEFKVEYKGTEKGLLTYARRGSGYHIVRHGRAPSKSC